MKVNRQALGSLSVRAYKDKPFYEVKWRDATRTQRKRRLGRARLLEESARIVTVELSGLSAKARQLSTQWSEQSVLDPESAARTLAELEAELNRVELPFLSLHKRQREIAGQMRAMLES